MADMPKKMQDARIQIILSQVFFRTLLFRVEFHIDKSAPTMWTDGRRLGYNPKFIDSLSFQEVQGVICHELLHCVMLHPYRIEYLPYPSNTLNESDEIRKQARAVKANMAADYAINSILKEMKLTLPAGALLDEKYAGLSMEEIYHQLPDVPIVKINSSGLGCGEVRQAGGDGGDKDNDGGVSESDSCSRSEWKAACVHAVKEAKAAGKLPASLERLVDGWTTPQVDYRTFLRQFTEQAAKADYSWRHPSKRYLAHDFFLPSLYSQELGPIIVVGDTSGSIGEEELKDFTSTMQSIFDEFRPSRMEVLWADADVAGVQVFEPGDEVVFKPCGGGGTDFRPAFEYAAKIDDALCVIYLTDMMGTFPEPQDVSIPTCWLSMTKEAVGPFGVTVYFDPNVKN